MSIDLKGRAKLVVEEERAQVVSSLASMVELSRQSSEEVELMRQETGTKESLAEPARFPKADLSKGESLVPPLRPEQTQVDTGAIQQAVDETLSLGEPTFDVSSQVSQDNSIQSEAQGGALKERLIAALFQAEGGYSTDVNDPGNYYKGEFIGTNHGISAPTLARHLGRTPTVDDMKGLSKEVAADIAFNDYYERFNIGALPEELQEIVFHSVYLGESRGVKALQELLGVTVDGAVGPKTTEAMRNADFTKEQFRDTFLQQLRRVNTWDEHGKGWTNRFNELAQ